MGFWRKLSRMPNQFLYKIGKRSYVDYWINQLPPEDQQEGRRRLQELTDTTKVTNPVGHFQALQSFNDFLIKCKTKDVGDEVKKTYTYGTLQNGNGYFGTTPQGSKIWSLFANPFAVFAYVADQYWAVGRCVDLVRETIEADGFALQGAPGVSPEKLQEYYKKLKAIDIDQLWVEIPIHEMLFGNFFGLPHFSRRNRTLKKFEILYPPRLYPIFDTITAEVKYYDYTIGRLKRRYTVDEVDHLMRPSLWGTQLGPPPLLPCITEIETALMTISFNNNVMQKGFLPGKIVSLKAPEGSDFNPSINADWEAQVQTSLDAIHSGTKAGQGAIALTGVDNVHDITKPGEVELNFRESRPELDKRICNRLGIPSEKIGIPRSTTAQYQPSLVENVVNAQFDTTINCLTARSARFLNKYVLQEQLGIYDAKLVPAGRYGAITLSAAQTLKELAMAGPITTVNEARVNVLGWAPLPPNDPRGNQILNNSMDRDVEAVRAGVAPDPIDPELEMEKDLGRINEDNCLYITFGVDGGRISKERPAVIRAVIQEKD